MAHPTSTSWLAVKALCNLCTPHLINIIRCGKVARHEAKAAYLSTSCDIQCDDFDQRPAGFGNDERLSPGGLLHQSRQVCFSLVNVDCTHNPPAIRLRGYCEITVALLRLLAVLLVLSSSPRLATLISQQPLSFMSLSAC